jgi:hypothetical protein
MQLYDMYNTNEFVIILSSYAFECIQIKVKATASTNVPPPYFGVYGVHVLFVICIYLRLLVSNGISISHGGLGWLNELGSWIT